MNINKNNYEEFFIDYVDGKLSAEEVAELMLFIAANPDLKEELNMLEQSPVLELSEVDTYVNKDKLKKEEFTSEIISNAVIAEFENVAQAHELEILKKVPLQQLEKERKIIALTRQTPDLAIVFPDKQKLKHKTKVISMFYYYAAAAACLLIMLGTYNMFNPTNSNNNLASNNVKVEKNVLNKSLKTNSINIASNQKPAPKTVKKTFGKKVQSNFPVINEETNEAKEVIKNQEPVLANANSATQNNESKIELENNFSNLDKNLILAQIPETKEHKVTSNLEAVTPTDYVYKNVTGELPEQGKENRLMNLARFAAAGIEKVTGKQAKAQKTKKDCGTKYNFKIGDLEFERSIACK